MNKDTKECLSSSTTFQVQVTIKNFHIHQCVVDDGASSCIMSFSAWEHIFSPTLVPSNREIQAFDEQLYSPINILRNLPIDLGGKIVLITIIIMPGPVDYNILLIRQYIYAMQAVVSSLS